MKPSRSIPFAILFGGIIIAGAIYAVTPKHTTSALGDPTLVRPVGTSDHTLGNPAAKVTIVEYADFDCDYCRQFAVTLKNVVSDEAASGNVAWVYREFPLTEIHPNAMKHAEAAECAAQVAGNDAFWKFSDLLFANQPVDPSQYGTLAGTLNIPGEAFATCYANAATTVDAQIQADRKNALDMGATGTPYSILLVSGKPPLVLSGGFSYDELKTIIDQSLAN